MMQSTSKKRCLEESTSIEDRITMLPDEIVISIVSHLKLAEAARTSVLSRRWRYLWTYTTGILDFAKSDCTLHGWSIRRFIKRVNLVLNLHKSCTIDEFRVCCVLREGSSDIIDNWINSALQRHAKRLVLDFGCQFVTHQGHYALRAKIFSSCSSSLRSLTALHLCFVDITGEVIEYILSNAPLLQELRLKRSHSLERLKIAGPSPHLRRLQIEDCCYMMRLEVHAINIVSFAYCGLNLKLSIYFKETSHLIEAKLDTVFCDKYIYYYSSYFSRLESLVLDLKRWNSNVVTICREIPKLPLFRKLKQLEVSFSGISVESYIFRCTQLLKGSPSLQRFVLKIYDIQGYLMEADFVIRAIIHRRIKIKYQHKQLKVLEFVGFLGHKKDVAIALSLLAILPSLQKLVIDPNPICSIRQSNPGSDLDTDFDAYSDTTVATADQLLRKSLPRGAEFVVIPHSDNSCPK